MARLEFRPRFRFHTPLSTDDVIRRVETYFDTSGTDDVVINNVKDHIVVEIPIAKRHFWSPHMDVNLEFDDFENQTLVRCLIGPSPTVWTMFMFFYGFFGFMAFVGLTLGMSQWTLQKPMWGFWFVPAALIGMALMYGISYEGKKLAHDEMRALKHFLDRALDCDCFAIAEEQRMA